MTLQASGPISFSDLQVEYGGTPPLALNAYYRGGARVQNIAANANVPLSGTISLQNFYGQGNSTAINRTIAADENNFNFRAWALSQGWDGVSPLDMTVTVNSGVYVSANSTSIFAIDTGTPFPTGSVLRLINNGFIVGMGGAAGTGRNFDGTGGNVGLAAGTALRAQFALQVTNNGTIAGAGGGGGGGNGFTTTFSDPKVGTITNRYGGGGGGGGRSSRTNSAGAIGGLAPDVRANSGSPGTATAAGAGGDGLINNASSQPAYKGGNGGGWGQAGQTGPNGGLTGGAAGAAVSGNANITWVVPGTRLGALT